MKSAMGIEIRGTFLEFRRWQLWFPLFVVVIAAVSEAIRKVMQT